MTEEKCLILIPATPIGVPPKALLGPPGPLRGGPSGGVLLCAEFKKSGPMPSANGYLSVQNVHFDIVKKTFFVKITPSMGKNEKIIVPQKFTDVAQ